MKRALLSSRRIRLTCARHGSSLLSPSTCFSRVSPPLAQARRVANAHRPVTSSSQWTSTPREFPSSGYELVDASVEMEEETLPTYHPGKYLPVRQGEVLDNRYQVLAKVGYGVSSTVWFGRDLVESKYVVLKVYVADHQNNHELKMYEHINSLETDHPGRGFIRKLYGSFSIEGPGGTHICLVHEPLGFTARELIDWTPGQKMSLKAMKPCIRQLLLIVDFLHSVAHVIHTDLQLKNLLQPAPEAARLSSFEERAIKYPLPRKVLEDRVIHTSSLLPPGDGLPLLCDFGEARFGEERHDEDIMPVMYRAPEVVLKMNWDYKVDIWSVAMIAWDIVCPRRLFQGINSDGIFDDRVHLAEMVALLGPPPLEFRQRSNLSSVFWDDNGSWKDLAPVPDITLEGLAEDIEGEDKEGFLRWIRAALQWNPEERATALELLYDEWLMKGLKSRSKSV